MGNETRFFFGSLFVVPFSIYARVYPDVRFWRLVISYVTAMTDERLHFVRLHQLIT
jgi:hypothetical protein